MVKVMRSIVRGSVAPYVAGFAAELLEQGWLHPYVRGAACLFHRPPRSLVVG